MIALACILPSSSIIKPINGIAKVNKKMNRLSNFTSPYLLQHANNPAEWHPWDSVVFEKAKAENKPIFLSIGYT